MRLQVYLSHSGVCSRRKAMDIIKAGRVTLNGAVHTEPSTDVLPGRDKVAVDGKPVQQETYDYIALHKPAGYITTKTDRYNEQTVLELLPKNLHHVSPVGRLDKDTEGLLLLTNDGDAAYQLTHPKFEVDKVYKVVVKGQLTVKAIQQIERGIEIDGEKTAPAQVKTKRPQERSTEFELTIHEGKKRQIRRMMEAVGHPVIRLVRLAHGPLRLGRLLKGHWRYLSEAEIRQIKRKQGR